MPIRQVNKMRKPRRPEIDIGLHALVTHAEKGQTLSARDIAEVCGCSSTLVDMITDSAIQKLRLRARRSSLADYYDDSLEINPADHHNLPEINEHAA